MTSLSKKFAIVAAAGLAIAPIAAQAGTRAESSPVAVDVQRGSAGTTDVSNAGSFNPAWVLLLLALIAVILAVVNATDGRTRG
jgi:hypothetical protein